MGVKRSVFLGLLVVVVVHHDMQFAAGEAF